MAEDHYPDCPDADTFQGLLGAGARISRASIGWLDWGLWRRTDLSAFLGLPISVHAGTARPSAGTAFLGWGRKRSGLRALKAAQRFSRAFLLLEDGFLRSVGGNGQRSYSLVSDDEGIYYDASCPSRLERLIRKPLSDAQSARARLVMAMWRDGRLSKYNGSRDIEPDRLPARFVLVVDQTYQDLSVQYGNADARTFDRMLHAALDDNPDAQVLVKIHPEVAMGRKKGYFDVARLAGMPRVTVIADDRHPAALLEHAQAVYVATSQMGFEALLYGKPVHVFGTPFYAGWGLTHDYQPAPSRRTPCTLEQLVHAALIDYASYLDPDTGKRCNVETLIAWLALQRRLRNDLPPAMIAVGFSNWKKRFVREFLSGSTIKFVKSPGARHSGLPMAMWGAAGRQEMHGARALYRIEDGFLRSVGLGAQLIRPISWVIDDIGIYYDATQPSRLERLLADTAFDEALCCRARMLRAEILRRGITKYNLKSPRRWQRPGGQRVVLVVGQVETDASIHFGASALRTNLALLQAVRQAEPGATILFKPHPDMVAGLREPDAHQEQLLDWCDELIDDVAIDALYPEMDAVHVNTSLAGFEALMRQIPVVVWGQPFYAGWGLTDDRGLSPEVMKRRGRSLSLDELVAATLILYPRYINPATRQFCTPEQAVRQLAGASPESRPRSLIRGAIARACRKK